MDNFDTLSLLPKLRFITDLDSRDNAVTASILFISLNYLGQNKSLSTPLITLIESNATKHFELIANFMRYTSLDFSNIYVPLGYSDESIPLISMMVVTNNVELFTILYEKGVNLSRRSSLGKLPSDYVTETTDPRITLALIHQHSSSKKLTRYKKRHSEISSFLENARSICESTPSLQKLTDLLSQSCFEPDTYRRHIMFYFNELISRNVVTQNTIAILIKWWINCVCFCIQTDEAIPNNAIGEMKTISKRYLSHPSPSKLSPQLAHKHFIFSLWRHQTKNALRTSKWGRLHKRQKTLTQLDSPRSLNKSNNNTNNVLTL